MGATFKYILIALILYYLWNNHIKNIVKVFFKGSSTPSGNNRSGADPQQQYRQQQEAKAHSRQQKSTTSTSTKEFRGGEYVDFEEVE